MMANVNLILKNFWDSFIETLRGSRCEKDIANYSHEKLEEIHLKARERIFMKPTWIGAQAVKFYPRRTNVIPRLFFRLTLHRKILHGSCRGVIQLLENGSHKIQTWSLAVEELFVIDFRRFQWSSTENCPINEAMKRKIFRSLFFWELTNLSWTVQQKFWC